MMAGVQKRKIRWTISLFLVMLYFSGLTAQAQYGGGTGEPNDPYLIYTAEQMNEIGLHEYDWDKHFKLMADIDLSTFRGTDFNIIGYFVDWDDNKPFTGTFDGNGYTISNFSYTSTDADSIGLFRYVKGKNAEIRDLGLIDPNIDGGTGNYVGSLVGWLRDGTITGCYVEGGIISGYDYIGGLVGVHGVAMMEEGPPFTISNCYSTSSVQGTWWVGGLVGSNSGTITNCYSTGIISGGNSVGGLAGKNGVVLAVVNNQPVQEPGMIYESYSTASVFATGSGSGALVGTNYVGEIANCYATGSVEGPENVGGLVGRNRATTTNCFSTASVRGGNQVGGLVGNNDGEVRVSFWDIETSAQTTSAGGTGLTTAEMQDLITFMEAGWDLAPHDVWVEPDGGGYPILWWQLSPLPELPKFSGGTGVANEPYLISTVEDLNTIGHNPRLMAEHFKLINDIDLTGVDFFIIGNRQIPFTGVFDGNNHMISNFTYDSNGVAGIGIFGYVRGENTQIKDLGLIDPNINAGTGVYVGSLIGWLRNGTITGCYVEGGSVSGNGSVGGLVGYNYSGPIDNCYAMGSIRGVTRVGGLVGYNFSGPIDNCYAMGSVWGVKCVGGLVGYIIGGRITNCYATGSVSGKWSVGGLVGSNWVGHSTITGCFWDIQTSGQVTSAGGMGKTTAEMQMESTFTNAGWDFMDETANGTEDVWWILEGRDYPRLWWEEVSELEN